MSSIIYNSFFEDLGRGAIDLDTDTFYAMAVTSSYVPDKDAHTKRSQVTNEAVGTNYPAGGAQTAVTVTKDVANDRLDVTFGDVAFPNATLTGRAAVIYKRRGGASSADELVAYVDWGADKTSTAGLFTMSFSSPLRIQN